MAQRPYMRRLSGLDHIPPGICELSVAPNAVPHGAFAWRLGKPRRSRLENGTSPPGFLLLAKTLRASFDTETAGRWDNLAHVRAGKAREEPEFEPLLTQAPRYPNIVVSTQRMQGVTTLWPSNPWLLLREGLPANDAHGV